MEWYYVRDGQRQPPVTEATFRKMVEVGTITPETLVWNQTMPDWAPWDSLLAAAPVNANPATPNLTTQNASHPLASIAQRLVAKLFDVTVVVVGEIVLFFMLNLIGRDLLLLDMDSTLIRLLATGNGLVPFAIFAAYNTIFVARNGATPGKVIMGLKVEMADGQAPSTGRAFARAMAEWLSLWMCFAGYIFAFFDGQSRTLHDFMVNTRVVKWGN